MKTLEEWLKRYKITEIECVTPDQTGIARGKIMPTDKFLAEKGIRLPESVLLQTATGDYPDEEVYYDLLDPADIDMELKPDEGAVYMVPWATEPTALIIHDCYDRDDQPISLSPRNLLKHVIKLYKDQGWAAIVAPEVEFYFTQKLTDPDLPLSPPIGRSGRPETGRKSFSIDAVNEFDPITEDIYDWAEAQGLDIDTLIHEEGTAQLEFNFRHGDPLRLADQVFVFKRTVREAALKHDINATFMAKPVAHEPGSALHLHTSLVDLVSGDNLFSNADGSFSDLFRHYVGGLQKYIPYVMPMLAPNVNSYRRFLTGVAYSAPTNLDWGLENRTCGLRVPRSSSEARRIENRLPGADSNSYLAIAASMACGYLGMMEKLEPREMINGRNDEVADPTVPWNIEQALDMMLECQELRAAISDDFIRGFVATRWAEFENFKRVISSWEREHLLSSV